MRNNRPCITGFFFFFATAVLVIPRSVRCESMDANTTDCSSILQIPWEDRCDFSLAHCPSSLFNYFSLHFCFLRQFFPVSIPIFGLIILFQFYVLVQTANLHFSSTVTHLATALRLSPSMAGVTLLALGNGAPDAFASAAALRGGSARLGLGAILSTGAFVSGFVFGLVALYAAPFFVRPSQFFRDGFFYLVATSGTFCVYLSGSVSMWQAIGLVGFYFLFVVVVIWMDLDAGARGKGVERVVALEAQNRIKYNETQLCDREFDHESSAHGGDVSGMNGVALVANYWEEGCIDWTLTHFRKVSIFWEVPVSTVLRLTIPSTVPEDWSKFYACANIALCPIALLYTLSSFVPFQYPIVFLIPGVHFPLWSVVLSQSIILGIVCYVFVHDPPEKEENWALIFSFVMSVFWISSVAGELLSCLSAVGVILDLSPALVGLTVLAWGNSVGDLVADVAVAKAGQPAMAIAGCFAGPMFNMLIGFGSALVFQTAQAFPEDYELIFNVNIVVAFVFLLFSLMVSLFVVTWFRFRVPKFLGVCLVGLYAFFMSLVDVIIRSLSPAQSEAITKYSITKALCVAFVMTFFSVFDVPVFWPILLCYWIVLFVLTMKRQIMHMIKYKYVPFSIGKQKYTGKKPAGPGSSKD